MNVAIKNKRVNSFFRLLKNWDNESKKDLIVKLTQSINDKTETKNDFSSCFGAWEDSRSADEIINDIRADRVNKPDLLEFWWNICLILISVFTFFEGQCGLQEKFEKIGFDNFAISEITLAELIYGAEKSQYIESNMKIVDEFANQIEILPILPSLRIYAKEKARLKKKGTLISDFDLLIGATAIVNDMILVTRNIREFERLNEISLENWIDH